MAKFCEDCAARPLCCRAHEFPEVRLAAEELQAFDDDDAWDGAFGYLHGPQVGG